MGHPPLSDKLWTREQVAARILAGDTLFVYDSLLVRVPPSWLATHPGGRLSILHFVGRDATDEVDAFHPADALRKLRGFVVGRVDPGAHGWAPFVPPIATGWVRRPGADGQLEWYNEARPLAPDAAHPPSEVLLVKGDGKAAKGAQSEAGPTFAQIQPAPNELTLENEKRNQEAYKELHRRVTEAGLYDTPFLTGYGPEFVRYTLLAVASAVCYRHDWLILSALFLGLFWHQLTFFAHDLGHVGVTHDWTLDRLISIFVADFLGGLSIGWWVNVSLRSIVSCAPECSRPCRTTMCTTVSCPFCRSEL